MKRYTSSPMTMGELDEMIRQYGLDQDEYFSPTYEYRNSDWKDVPLWGDENDRVRWVACYAVEGGSEGYYVHVSQIRQPLDADVNHETILFIGKFWSPEAALRAASLITQFVHGWLIKEVA